MILAAVALAGCASPGAVALHKNGPKFAPPTAQRPGEPAGTEVAPGIEVVERIPVEELTTTQPVILEGGPDPCSSIPPDLVAPAGFTDPPVLNDSAGCSWLSADNLVLTISSIVEETMAKEVADHITMANVTNELSQLSWLRIDGHYAIQRMLKYDSASTCWITIDMSAPRTVAVHTYEFDPHRTGADQAVDMDARTSLKKLCPTSLKVAQTLIQHFLP